MNDYRVLVLAPNDWDGPWMNRQQIMSRLGKDVEVVYTTPLWTNWDVGGDKWRQAEWRGSFFKTDNVWIDQFSKYFIRIPRLPFVTRWVEQIEVWRLQKFLARMRAKKLLVYVFRPEFQRYLELLNPDAVVYHIYDVYDFESDWTNDKARQQRWILERADLVIASSEQMAKRLVSSTGYSSEVHVLKNGADVVAFKDGLNASEPLDLSNIEHPRISYIGRLNVKVDWALILELATRQPKWQFVLVGPEVYFDAAAKDVVNACRARENIHFLGSKSHSELPAYAAAMDVNALFYVLDESAWSFYGFPLKLHEYLAVGKPVVSSDMESVREYESVVNIAHDPDEWERKIAAALNEETQKYVEYRQQVAAENSWDKRVAELRQWIGQIATSQ